MLGMGLGATIGWMVLLRFGKKTAASEAMIDERQQQHNLLAGYCSFLFLNFLLIGGLLQPWVPHAQTGLWTGILMVGLGFYLACLRVLDRRRK